jgi:hypothetical protein
MGEVKYRCSCVEVRWRFQDSSSRQSELPRAPSLWIPVPCSCVCAQMCFLTTPSTLHAMMAASILAGLWFSVTPNAWVAAGCVSACDVFLSFFTVASDFVFLLQCRVEGGWWMVEGWIESYPPFYLWGCVCNIVRDVLSGLFIFNLFICLCFFSLHFRLTSVFIFSLVILSH